MVVRWITAVPVCLGALGATQTAADRGEVSDPRPPAGSHDIRRLVLDNTGDRVGVTAVPTGARSRDAVRLAYDVVAGAAVDFVAVPVPPELPTRPYCEG